MEIGPCGLFLNKGPNYNMFGDYLCFDGFNPSCKLENFWVNWNCNLYFYLGFDNNISNDQPSSSMSRNKNDKIWFPYYFSY